MSAVLPILVSTAKQEPNRLALIWNNHELSYQGFVTRIAAVRKRFEALELQPGLIAAVMINHLVQGWITALALQSAGVITIAVRSVEELDTFNLPHLAYLVTHSSEALAGLTVSPTAARLRNILIHPFSSHELAVDISQLELPAGGGHILSTSGTTGVYKHVLFDVRGQELRIANRSEMFPVSPETISYNGNFGLWTSGGLEGSLQVWSNRGVVVFDQRPTRHLSFAERRITRAGLVPSELEAILRAPDGELPFNPEMQIFAGGATLPWRLAEQAMARMTPQVFSALGSTEAGAIACTRVQGPRDQLTHVIDPSRQVDIVDEANRAVSPGTAGLVRVRLRPGDANGYLEDEAATRAFFRDGFFYPGDLASLEPDGRLKLHGRASEVLNLRGNKVATLPAEKELQAHLGASAVCILSEPQEDGEEALYIALELDRPLTRAERTLLETAVPGWKPTIHFVESMPRNDMGKIDRIELRRRLSAASSPAVGASS